MAQRTLTLTEELERLEQQITLTLQEIDSNFSKAHRIVTSSIIPIVEEHGKHSAAVWEGSKFWKQFFEASANVSLSGYEEPADEEELTQTETSTSLQQTPTQAGEGEADEDEFEIDTELRADDDDEEYSIESPTQVTGVQSTPRLPPSSMKRPPRSGTRTTAAAAASSRYSPSPRKHTSGGGRRKPTTTGSTTPSTPRAATTTSASLLQSSPFEPDSGYRPPSTFRSQQQQQPNPDPLLHRVLDKTYRIQATPLTSRRQQLPHRPASTTKPTPQTTTTTSQTERKPWDDSPGSSPIAAAPQLRSELFSPSTRRRTPGVSVLTPRSGRKAGGGASSRGPTTSTGRRLFSPQDKTYAATREHARAKGGLFAAAVAGDQEDGSEDDELIDYDDEEDEEEDVTEDNSAALNPRAFLPRQRGDASAFSPHHHRERDPATPGGFFADDTTTTDAFDYLPGLSPPKTLQFHVPQSRLLQTPAREASRRIVDDLLLTAGADATDDIEGPTEGGGVGEPPSPSVVFQRVAGVGGLDDTF